MAKGDNIYSFLTRVFKPAPISKSTEGSYAITGLMWALWCNRKDLQLAFDLNTGQGQQDYWDWYQLYRPFSEYPAPLAAASGQSYENGNNPVNTNVLKRLPFLIGKGISAFIPELAKRWVKKYYFKWRIERFRKSGGADNQANLGIWESLPGGEPISPVDIILVGYPDRASGMGEHLRMSAASFGTTNIDFQISNLDRPGGKGQPVGTNNEVLNLGNPGRINLLHINADQVLNTVSEKGTQFFQGRMNILYPFWELSKFPKEWVAATQLMDEIWAPTRFIQTALEDALNREIPHLPIAVELPPYSRLERRALGLQEDAYIFFCSFDFLSYIHRKNPWSVVEAFLKAFPSGREKVHLIIKAMNVEKKNPNWLNFKRLTSRDSRIILRNDTMSRQALLALQAACDCYVSLHRSEGFGLGPAEAMLMGKPVIITNYSGSTDYALEDHAFLVDYRLIPVKRGQYPFGAGQTWADPDTGQAAFFMNMLYQGPGRGIQKGEKAREYLVRHHSAAVCGSRYQDRLRFLGMISC